jgi:hypothetical protein
MATDKRKAQISEALFQDSTLEGDCAYVEQYKLYLEMLDKISERRQQANSFFLTVNTGVCAFIGYLFSKDTDVSFKNFFWFVPVAGILLSYFWYRLIKSYRDLNSAKFHVVHLMEQRLPLAPYHAEWIALGEGKDRKVYVPFTHLEIWVPRSFMLMYAILIMYMVPWSSFSGSKPTPSQQPSAIPAPPKTIQKASPANTP